MSRRVNSGGVLAVGGWNEDMSAGISQTAESLAGGINTKLRAVRRIKISLPLTHSLTHSLTQTNVVNSFVNMSIIPYIHCQILESFFKVTVNILQVKFLTNGKM